MVAHGTDRHVILEDFVPRFGWLGPIGGKDVILVENSKTKTYQAEAKIINTIINNFRYFGCMIKMTILAPFVAQCKILEDIIQDKNTTVMTIDKAQGTDCDIVMLSCCVNAGNVPLLS